MTYGASTGKAMRHFETALELTPESPIAHIEFGNGLYLLFADRKLDEVTELYIKALDPQGRALEGIRFRFGDVESLPTTITGVTTLQVPPLSAGESIRVDLPSSLSEEWFLVDSTVHVPAGQKEGPAEVVLMRGLARTDVFPAADLGVVKYLAIELLGRAEVASESEMRAFAEAWRPHRSLALVYAYAEMAERSRERSSERAAISQKSPGRRRRPPDNGPNP